MTTTKEFVISRTFDAPRDLVWKAFTDPAHMKEWWGPKGSKVSQLKIDLRVGGICHYALQMPGAPPMWGKFVYREIAPPERIVLLSSFSDEAGGVTRHPMAPTWPERMLSIFTFEEVAPGKTKFTVHWSPYEASAEEQQTFDGAHTSMQGGWTGTLDQLEAHLAKAKGK